MPTCPDPLEQVCGVGEYAQRTGKHRLAVHRLIQSGKLQARKSGGIWLVRHVTEHPLSNTQ